MANNSMTRAEAAVVIHRLINDPNKNILVPSRFTDVPNGMWHTNAINYLANVGILEGYHDGTFRPNNPITRAEFATLVVRFYETSNTSASIFSDVPTTHWANVYIAAADQRGWVTGYGDGTFRPNNNITRAEVVTLMNRVLDRVPNPSNISTALAGRVLYNDLENTHWAFYDIMEASIDHEFVRDDMGLEIWTWFQLPTPN
jgi:hypothetical protein